MLYNCTFSFKFLTVAQSTALSLAWRFAYAMRPVKTLNKNTKKYFIFYLSFQKTQLCSYGWVGLNTFPRWRKEIFRSSSPVAGTLTKLDRVHGGMHSITDPEGPSTYEISLYIWSLLILRRLRVNIWTIISYLDVLDIICWVINHHFVKRKTYKF